jgi:hypothetical protein
MAKLIGYVGNKSVAVDDNAAFETKLKAACPRLLQDDEHVVMAFAGRAGWGRDDSCFTNKRLLIRDVRALTGSCVKYTSIPYHTIKAWSVDTAGMMDPDCTLKVWSQGIGLTSIDYLTGHVDMFQIMRHFNRHCLVGDAVGATAVAEPTMPEPTPPSACDKLLGFLGDDASQIDKGKVEEELKHSMKILLPSETVELAFKAGRDSFVLTSHRVLQIDVQGLTGKKVEYISVLWKQIKMFSVTSAGSFDTDAELVLFTDIPGLNRIEQDLRKGKVDLMAIQKFFADKLLGTDATEFSGNAVTMAGVADQGSGSIFAWMGDDSRMIDAAQMNQQYHMNPPLLQGSEMVEMAFKGRRDMMLFTTKRLIKVDVQGFTGKKVCYVSIPWKTVQCFGVRSAGAWLDKDSEMFIWTNVNDVYWPPKDGDNQPPPIPRMSYIECDFQKDKVDLMSIHRYLSERCLRVQGGGYLAPEVQVNPAVIQSSGSVEKFLEWLGQDARMIPASQIEQQLKTTNPMIQHDEHVGMAFQVGRDMIIFTTKRVLSVDVQGWSGKKVEWKSIPYEAIRGFSVESAGSFDRDAEVKLFTKTHWINGGPGSVFSQDLRKGKCDIMAMQSYIAAQVFGRFDGSSNLPPPLEVAPPEKPGGMEGVLNWLGNDAHEISAEDADKTLHENPPILQSDEKVEKAFKCGRDTFIFTTKRVLFIDVQGWTGKKIEYMSYPLRYCQAFEVQSAGAGIGKFFHTAHAAIFTDVPGRGRIEQDLSKGGADIWSVHDHMCSKLLPHVDAHAAS